MANFYCEYCGSKYSSISTLTNFNCQRHPSGAGKGKHKLYEGNEKSEYNCKYCGSKYSNIGTLTNFNCQRHPSGAGKGKHAPVL
jgi:DNA-directed RNA polymerase subunit RPC12/RpoP